MAEPHLGLHLCEVYGVEQLLCKQVVPIAQKLCAAKADQITVLAHDPRGHHAAAHQHAARGSMQQCPLAGMAPQPP